jgi:hypothetical protein
VSKKKCPNYEKEIYNDKYRHIRERLFGLHLNMPVLCECMFRENLNGGMSMSVFGIATSSCEILYNMTRRASDFRSAGLRQFICSIMLLTLELL